MPRAIDVARAALAPATRTSWFRWFARKGLPPIERFLSRISRGRFQLTEFLVPSLVLHTIGAKSGEPRDAPLMYTADGKGRAIVAGTNWAGARHPAWTVNLLAHPDVEITVRGKRMAVHASLVPDDERDATWAIMEAQWPDYREYERDSGRTARIFVLQPVRRQAAAPESLT
ncbi:nitroreductase family deazaflavin-dependent oxidoreductase [Microbacterium sp. SS28]|uniref:nitroreductase family deazaflavin-dependent oxidoreductase n=1 Tax=Microbacterium sp. SS28 TaxID=2919948 RepID=UPI001FAAB137|nr:nitroreductase family deazaflavin-dependent oxidoreductase [Microbacterium sp. SS28]